MRRQKRLTSFTSGYGQMAWIVPSVVAAPRYFRGELGLGGLMQTTSAFQQVQDSLSFFVQSYKEVASWRAVVARLAGFDRALERVRLDAARDRGAHRAEGSGPGLAVDGVDLYRPDGQPLIADVTLSIAPATPCSWGGPAREEHALPGPRRIWPPPAARSSAPARASVPAAALTCRSDAPRW